MAPYPISDETALPQVAIYVEDSRGLNTTDWSPSNAPSRLKDWVQSGRIDVQVIQDVDLAIFTPSMLVETKSGTTYRLANSNLMSHISTVSRARCQGDSSIDESGDPCMALLVRQTPHAESKSLKDGT